MSAPDAKHSGTLEVHPAVQEGRQLTAKIAVPMIGLGLIWSLIALALDFHRTSFAYLLGFSFIWSIVIGSLFLLALHYLTHAVWSVVVKRIIEMFVSPMPLLALLFIPVICLSSWLFSWLSPSDDPILQGKTPYLNLPFFILRAVIFFAVWIWFGQHIFIRLSLLQDEGKAGPEATKKMRDLAAPFMLIFAITVTFAAIDWWMSLEPLWFSTVFGVYAFAGIVVSALSAVILAIIWMKRAGILAKDLVTPDHMYSLGALVFAFSCFWGYIAVSQYLLIWYGNLPEETFWYVERWKGGWIGMSFLLMFLRFVLPFFALLSRGSKMNENRLQWVCILLLLGQLVDLHWLIMPQVRANASVLSWHEFGPLLLMIGILLWSVSMFLQKNKPVAVGDPMLESSRHFHL